MRPQSPKDPLAELASRQHGVVTRRELLAAGMQPGQIQRRVRSGALTRVHPGVYRVGHAAPSMEATYLAAVKACGDRSLLAGRAAARLHRLFRSWQPPPEVITPNDRRLQGIVIRRTEVVPDDATTHRGIPITTVPRTLVDLAAVLSPSHLARAVHEASVLHDLDPDDVEVVLSRRHNWPGSRELRRVLHGDVPVTLSRLESRFLQRLRVARLPQPVVNARVDGRWPDHRLTVELDGYRYHRTRHAWEQDRAREREARARGDEFRRYTYLDVFEHPGPMVADLRRLLTWDRPRLWSPDDPYPGQTTR